MLVQGNTSKQWKGGGQIYALVFGGTGKNSRGRAKYEFVCFKCKLLEITFSTFTCELVSKCVWQCKQSFMFSVKNGVAPFAVLSPILVLRCFRTFLWSWTKQDTNNNEQIRRLSLVAAQLRLFQWCVRTTASKYEISTCTQAPIALSAGWNWKFGDTRVFSLPRSVWVQHGVLAFLRDSRTQTPVEHPTRSCSPTPQTVFDFGAPERWRELKAGPAGHSVSKHGVWCPNWVGVYAQTHQSEFQGQQTKSYSHKTWKCTWDEWKDKRKKICNRTKTGKTNPVVGRCCPELHFCVIRGPVPLEFQSDRRRIPIASTVINLGPEVKHVVGQQVITFMMKNETELCSCPEPDLLSTISQHNAAGDAFLCTLRRPHLTLPPAVSVDLSTTPLCSTASKGNDYAFATRNSCAQNDEVSSTLKWCSWSWFFDEQTTKSCSQKLSMMTKTVICLAGLWLILTVQHDIALCQILTLARFFVGRKCTCGSTQVAPISKFQQEKENNCARTTKFGGKF